jgi:nucleoside-diphosphate-sugar epimerase
MRVLIVGCGYVGLALGKELVRQGHSVCGLRRSDRLDGELGSAGIAPVKADVTVPESFPPLGDGFDLVVYCVSASGGSAAEYERIYVRGMRHVISWLSAVPPAKFVYTSSTSVYGQTDGSSVDETSPTEPLAATGKILVKGEKVLLKAAEETGFPAVVLRVAGIYGPGRTYWLDQVRAGAVQADGANGRIVNMVHREDVVGAVIAALTLGRPGQVCNAVDDEPVNQLALLQWLSKRLGSRLGPAIAAEADGLRKRGLTNKRVSNARLKQELGYRFKFPSFREGFESILSFGVAEVRLP